MTTFMILLFIVLPIFLLMLATIVTIDNNEDKNIPASEDDGEYLEDDEDYDEELPENVKKIIDNNTENLRKQLNSLVYVNHLPDSKSKDELREILWRHIKYS